MVSFYLITNPSLSLRSFFSSHLLFAFFINLSCNKIFDFIIKFMDPSDTFFKFNEIEVDALWKYFEVTNLFGDLITTCNQTRSKVLTEKFDPNYKHTEIQSIIEIIPGDNKRYRHESLKYFSKKTLEKRDFSSLEIAENTEKIQCDVDLIEEHLMKPVNLASGDRVFGARKSLSRYGTLVMRNLKASRGPSRTSTVNMASGTIKSLKIDTGFSGVFPFSQNIIPELPSPIKSPSRRASQAKMGLFPKLSVGKGSQTKDQDDSGSVGSLTNSQHGFPRKETGKKNVKGLKASFGKLDVIEDQNDEKEEPSGNPAVKTVGNYQVIYTNLLPPNQKYKQKPTRSPTASGSFKKKDSNIFNQSQLSAFPSGSPNPIDEKKRLSSSSSFNSIVNGNPEVKKTFIAKKSHNRTASLVNELREQKEKYRLYPTDSNVFIDLEQEYKKQVALNNQRISENERGLMVLEVIKFVVTGSAEASVNQRVRESIGLAKGKLTKFWDSFFRGSSQSFIDSLFKHYLFNIHVSVKTSNYLSSGFVAGEILNLILKNRSRNNEIILYSNLILQSCLDNLPMLHYVFHHVFQYLDERESLAKKQQDLQTMLAQARSGSMTDVTKISPKKSFSVVNDGNSFPKSPGDPSASPGSSSPLSLGVLRLLLAETIVLIVQSETIGKNQTLHFFPDPTLDIFINWFTCHM